MPNRFQYWENDTPDNHSTYRVCVACHADVAEGWQHPTTGTIVCDQCKADLADSNDTP